MKCWVVLAGCEGDDEWCTLMHAESSGKAKVLTMRQIDGDDFLEFRARRVPGLDDRPINYENAKAAGFEYRGDYYSDDLLLPTEEFINDCPCEVCKSGRSSGESLSGGPLPTLGGSPVDLTTRV